MAGLADWDEGSAYFEKFSLIFSSSPFVIEKKNSLSLNIPVPLLTT